MESSRTSNASISYHEMGPDSMNMSMQMPINVQGTGMHESVIGQNVYNNVTLMHSSRMKRTGSSQA